MSHLTDVCFYEAFAEEAAELARLLPPHITATYTDRTIQESGHTAPTARLISVRTQSVLPLAWSGQLGAILSRSTGYDHLQAYARLVDGPCPALGYLPLYCHRAVAEQALLMWMALLRKLPRQVTQFASFHRDGLTGGECLGRTLVVVGVGNIGYEVCRLGRALGMQVFGVDIAPQYEDLDYLPPVDAFARADVVVCAMNLSPGNRGYFNRATFEQFKRGAVFVNISRGELSPSTELLGALEAGLLAGVGLDVYDHEPALATSLRSQSASTDAEVLATLALSRRPDCLCTPHNAFNTHEAVVRKSEHSVRQIVAWLKQGRFLWSPPAETE